MVEIERAYDPPLPRRHRVLVDRLWPRGVTKQRAALDEWARDVAPSTELRRWYGHNPARFEEFARRYRAELAAPGSAGARALAELRSLTRGRSISLVTATRDIDHSGAIVLRDLLSS